MSDILNYYGQVLQDVELYGADTADANAARDQVVAGLKQARTAKANAVSEIRKLETQTRNKPKKIREKVERNQGSPETRQMGRE